MSDHINTGYGTRHAMQLEIKALRAERDALAAEIADQWMPLRDVAAAAQAASAAWEKHRAKMEKHGATFNDRPGSAPVLMDKLAQALNKLREWQT